MAPTIDIVIPTAGRESLAALVDELAAQVRVLLPGRVVIVDDRRRAARPRWRAGSRS
jgi:hypothetical protein